MRRRPKSWYKSGKLVSVVVICTGVAKDIQKTAMFGCLVSCCFLVRMFLPLSWKDDGRLSYEFECSLLCLTSCMGHDHCWGSHIKPKEVLFEISVCPSGRVLRINISSIDSSASHSCLRPDYCGQLRWVINDTSNSCSTNKRQVQDSIRNQNVFISFSSSTLLPEGIAVVRPQKYHLSFNRMGSDLIVLWRVEEHEECVSFSCLWEILWLDVSWQVPWTPPPQNYLGQKWRKRENASECGAAVSPRYQRKR